MLTANRHPMYYHELEQYSDITIYNREEPYKLHRVVLAHVPFFEPMINPNSEWYTDRIDLDFHQEAWELCLAILYTKTFGMDIKKLGIKEAKIETLLNLVEILDMLMISFDDLKIEITITELCNEQCLDYVADFVHHPSIARRLAWYIVNKRPQQGTIIKPIDETFADVVRYLLIDFGSFDDNYIYWMFSEQQQAILKAVRLVVRSCVAHHLDPVWDTIDPDVQAVIWKTLENKLTKERRSFGIWNTSTKLREYQENLASQQTE